MNNAKQVLLIGGRFDGTRIVVDHSKNYITAQEMVPMRPRHYDTNYNDVYGSGENVVEQRYQIVPLAGHFIGVYSELDFREGIARLFNRYPKKRKKSHRQ